MPTGKCVRLMDAESIQRSLTRIAHEILERNKSLDSLALVGIHKRGVPLSERLASLLEQVGGRRPATGILDINLYRDDLSRIADHPVLRRTEIPFHVDGSRIVLVDDVLFTGRTIRAALEGLLDLGRPDWIQLVVLVDRGHRELPVRADYVGKNVPTSRAQEIGVRLTETDGADEVLLFDEAPRPGARGSE
jgi:pyrimidine operon attenuation protein/uracil phosphoribosyltransferase